MQIMKYNFVQFSCSTFRFAKDEDLDCHRKETSVNDVYDKYCDVIMWNTQATPPGDHHVQTNAPGKDKLQG